MGRPLRTLAPATAATLAAMIAAVACGFTGGGTGALATGAPFDATTSDVIAAGALVDAADPSDGATQLVFDDGGADADVDAAACTPVPLDALTSASWALLGSATISGSSVRLTPQDMGSTSGAVWWKTPITFTGRLHVVLDFSFALGSKQGDGITVAWIPVTKPYTLGPQGQSYGTCNAGLQGSAVAVDTRDNQFVVVSPIVNCDTSGVVTVSSLPTAKKVTVDITPAAIKASLDTGTTIQRSVTSPTTGYLGFTAATGGGFTGHSVVAVSASSCP